MLNKPTFKYYLSRKEYPVTKHSWIWKKFLPLSRTFDYQTKEEILTESVTYEDYFCAIRAFLEKGSFDIPVKAVSRTIGHQINPDEIEQILIFLEKHGEFYHPACVEICMSGMNLFFVINVAVSSVGKQYIKREYAQLRKMCSEFELCFVPKIYGIGSGTTKHGVSLSMFMGEWFQGFFEFHISVDQDNQNKLVIWDTEKENFFLSSNQALDVYRKCAMILTWHYNIESFEQIFSWHHAAGDFVVKPEYGDKVSMRLITVRKYAPIIQNPGDDPESMVYGLLVFLLNMSVKNRLDRLDGTGELVWAGAGVAQETLRGFFQGLDLKIKSKNIPDNFDQFFIKYLRSYSKKELYDTAEAVVKRIVCHKEELDFIKYQLKKHIAELHSAIANLTFD